MTDPIRDDPHADDHPSGFPADERRIFEFWAGELDKDGRKVMEAVDPLEAYDALLTALGNTDLDAIYKQLGNLARQAEAMAEAPPPPAAEAPAAATGADAGGDAPPPAPPGFTPPTRRQLDLFWIQTYRKFVPAVRKAFRVEPFQQRGGVRSGLTIEECVDLLQDFESWMNAEKKADGSTPSSAPPTPAASPPSGPTASTSASP